MWGPTEFAAVLGGLTGAAALSKQGYDIFHNRKRTKTAVEEALDTQPQVKKQLELGNVEAAIGSLNMIIESQAKHITRLNAEDMRKEAVIRELRRDNTVCRARIDELEERVDELEENHQKT